MSRIVFALKQWGDYIIRHMDFADEFGESILYRLSQFGYTEGEPGKAQILCPDMPPRVRRMDRAVAKLSELRKNCVKLNYCAPLRDDGQPYTKSQLARMLRINKGKFKAELRKAQKDLEKLF